MIMTAETKECPFCAETIRAAAIKCRFCMEWLPGYTRESATGNQVGGDKINTGNLEDVKGTAIGRESQAASTGEIGRDFIQAGGDVKLGKELRDEQYEIAQNWEDRGKPLMRGFDLSERDLSDLNLALADLRNANLSGANVTGTNLRDAILNGANLCGTSVNEIIHTAMAADHPPKSVNLSGAKLREADLTGARLRDAILSEANLEGAMLCDADLDGADLQKAILLANLRGAYLRGANLSGAMLYGSDLKGAILNGAILREAILSAANLSGTDLSSADLTDVIMEGTEYTTETIWPEDFDPKEAGTILVDNNGNPIEISE
jgi:uncharacterized protein YjbI with pentapeptide repeats